MKLILVIIWFKPYVAGYNAARKGYPDSREFVMDHMAELLT